MTDAAATSYAQLCADFRWRIPDRFNIARAMCERHAAATPDASALVFVEADRTTRVTTYGQLDAAASRLANVLAAHGVGANEIVAIHLPQCLEVILAHLACAKLGAIALPLAVLFAPDALRFRLADSEAAVLITTRDGYDTARDALADLPMLRHTLVVSPPGAPRTGDLDDLMSRASATRPAVDTAALDPAVMLYTSGTTGQPKGVLHAQRMPLASTQGFVFLHDGFPQPGDRMWTPADWAWAGGLNTVWTSLLHGATLVAERAEKFDPERDVDLMHRTQVRNAVIPPTALRLMRGLPIATIRAACDLRTLASGGEALGADMIAWGQDALGLTIAEGFGLTEAFVPVGNPPRLFPVRPGSMGRALPGHEMAVLGADDREVGVGERGQLALRRPNPLLFLEYRRNPAATAARFVGDWCLFGDLVTRDADGYLWFLGRNDDIINTSGYRLGPSEVEECLLRHPAVALAGAIGTPDPVRGEVVVAYLVLRPGHAGSDALVAELQGHVRARLAAHAIPRHVRFVDELPLTVTGKIRRLDLREMERTRHDRA